MTIQADFWQLVGLLGAFVASLGTIGVLLLKQIQSGLDERFTQLAGRLDGIEQVNRDETIQWQRVEREFLKFQADLPMRYVMRDDYIRGQTTIEAKLDAIAMRVENTQLRAASKSGGGS
ncbi:hypothetical protein [Variovorax boronicumulans]|uniref:hypothetical protein n=1 Tax=Variovorax boronicumulans TaxID=436515 RepID=UPI001C594C22